MSAKSVIGGLLILASGITGGWLMRDREIRLRPDAGNPIFREAAIHQPAPQSSLARAFEEWSSAGELAGAAIGFCVLDSDGSPIYESPLAETALCPASSLKTLTAGAAFGILGEEFRFETSLAASGEISPDGIVRGNLVLRGGGDPTLTKVDLIALADAAVKRGLKRVEGDIQIDATIFRKTR